MYDEGFDLVWKAYHRPYLKTPKGQKIYLDVRDNVPYLKPWPENTAAPASRIQHSSVQAADERKGPVLDESELLAKKLLTEKDFTHKSCLELISKARFKGPGAQRSAITSKAGGPNGSAQYAVLGVFCHGGVAGISNKTKDHPELTKYLCAYMKSIGVDEPFSSLCINHGSSVKIHTDSHNKYDSVSFSLGLGDYNEGGIWIHDEGVQGDGVRKKLPNGTIGLGRTTDTKCKLVKFNPKDYLCLEKWEGDRWSITAYTNRACHKLSDEEIGALRKLGFVMQKPSFPSSPAHKAT